jgi:lysophospholipase L1-like esterase
LIPALAAAESTNGPARWEKEIHAFELADQSNPPPKRGILFIGSSSIRLWTNVQHDFPKQPVINRGFGGSEIADSVYFMERIVFPCAPKQIVLYAGGNDIHYGKKPEQVFADFQAFVKKAQGGLPDTKITYISIAPNPARWAEVDRVRKANKLISEYIQRETGHPGKLEFVDVFSQMLGEDGLPKVGIYLDDQLHMNANGYQIWVKLLTPFLD